MPNQMHHRPTPRKCQLACQLPKAMAKFLHCRPVPPSRQFSQRCGSVDFTVPNQFRMSTRNAADSGKFYGEKLFGFKCSLSI